MAVVCTPYHQLVGEMISKAHNDTKSLGDF